MRRAVEELAASGFIEARSTAPASYRAEPAKWSELLAIDVHDPPAWRPGPAVSAFTAALDVWWDARPRDSAFVLASEARDLVAKHAATLEPAGVRFPAADRHRGETYLEPFASGLEELGRFIDAVT